jgi:hypothetical protein
MGDNRWSERILTWSQEGRKRRGRPEMKWKREMERVTMHKNQIPEDAVNRQIWRKATEKE